MAGREHNGGFVESTYYWDIGSAPRGRDGLSARDAAKRYNDHRHPATNCADAAAFHAWATEFTRVSYGEGGEVGGLELDEAGSLELPAVPLRRPGDMAVYDGLLWVWVSSSSIVPVGVGPGNYADNTTGVFNRETLHTSDLIAPAQFPVYTADTPNGAGVVPRGTRVGGMAIDMSRFRLARGRPYTRFRAVLSLIKEVPTVEEEVVLAAAPMRADVIFEQRVLNNGVVDGINLGIPAYASPNDVVPVMEFQQNHQESVITQFSPALILDLSETYYFEVYVRSHVYTQAEYDALSAEIKNAYSLDFIQQSTKCTVDILSVTLETEAVLGLAPLVNDNGVEITVSSIEG